SEAIPRRRIAPQALARFASRVRQLTRRQSGRSVKQTIAQLSVYLTGWRGYFGLLPDSLGLARPGRMGSAAAALPRLGAMALRPAALPRVAPTRDQHAAGGHHGGRGPRSWPVAAQPASRSPGRLAHGLLHHTWSAHPGAGHRMMPPPNRRVRTRTHGGVGGA